jgi:maltose alpha-D-glucosyltransferase/alpha-amylase
MAAEQVDERQVPVTPAPAPATRTSDLWWKNGVIYCLDVEKFVDGNGDGVGDFVGLTQKVDYLAGLGVTCLWLMPFYATPNRDDGYDVCDYYALDPRLGSFGDFVDFMRTARDRGLRVITELIVNHTSDEHPWFRAARDRGSPLHGFYVWQDEKPEEEPADIVFPDEESSVWAWDDEARRWYLHRFYSFQPDLNVGNPLVRDEIRKIAGFWLQLGVDGFRVDAVPYLVDTTGLEGDPHAGALDWLRELCSYIQRRDGSSVMIGEVNLPPHELRPYFGDDDGDGLHMLFNFNLNQALFLALARGECEPLDRALDVLPEIPERSQWVNFVRNHDELTLDKLDLRAREEIYRAFAPDEEMRLYGRGLRRRLPTMLDGDRARIELTYSLLFTLPGTPALLWGEEIGLAEDLSLEDRLAVRVPMQWSEGTNGGFSSAPPERLVAPVRREGPYGYERVNVASQRHDPDSLLNWMERMIRQRRECHEIGWGTPRRLSTGEGCVFAHRFDWEGTALLFAHNLAREPKSVELADGIGDVARLDDLLSGERVEPDGGTLPLELEGSGYRWFRVVVG